MEVGGDGVVFCVTWVGGGEGGQGFKYVEGG